MLNQNGLEGYGQLFLRGIATAQDLLAQMAQNFVAPQTQQTPVQTLAPWVGASAIFALIAYKFAASSRRAAVKPESA